VTCDFGRPQNGPNSQPTLRRKYESNVRFGSLADKPARAKIKLCPLLLQ
jgi:hypothetical protein